ncbi:phospho-N-acetylmuramoyl-pentapeptide-transferase [Candidatus Deianiraea vastatrix]|uniref:Phospho-N-acetylmuramoyl-pentapeptide-transferase n=1 Tax=Candidatus Deianiraea vastatrix TaxID=2163644 RepID=A0A5B8XEG6_9RICK|nr:phospho-N-acetylmuramoyl-pentapeptide-transferase [Candidatus Deianiraea vastatrix]QED23663.1 Phospho-N-acetylmuramoyl-pentapeptide-transferase [Candidatus Deianiraea vastatrix]
MSSYISFFFAKYITLRCGLAILTSFLAMVMIMPRGIRFLKGLQKDGQPIRNDGPETHAAKKGTPTMGGVFMVFSILLSSLIWCDLSEYKVWIVLLTMVIFCIIGFFDDFQKLTKKSTAGIRGKWKFIFEIVISCGIIYLAHCINPEQIDTKLYFPVLKNLVLTLGVVYFIFGALVITGASNAVNLTDGLDGLVSMPIFLCSLTLGIVAYFCGDLIYSGYLHIPHISGAGEISVFCAAMMGACLGFLWFNSKPADIFMGDTGSLPLGASLGIISVLIKQEILLFFAGMLFVIEALSVILQVGSYKLRNKKRIFLMAPLHHHYEKKGLSETKVVIRFWILAFLFNILALGMIKIR